MTSRTSPRANTALLGRTGHRALSVPGLPPGPGQVSELAAARVAGQAKVRDPGPRRHHLGQLPGFLLIAHHNVLELQLR
ncbi:hypothetical protein [Streptomyces sp. NPDC005046]